ncbi:MAG: ATP-dependent helicase, partial [Sandaracinaceae bacterium]|nr:ATP-dependent helicase [Sandaracinaceae bacterium]
AERHAEEELLAAGLDRALADARHDHRFEDPEEALALLDAIEARPELATVQWPDDKTRWRSVAAGRVDLGVRRAEHWFEASAKLQAGEDAVGLAALMTAFREQRRYVQLSPGRFARVTDELRAQLAALDPVVHVRGQSAQIAPSAVAYVGQALGEVEGDAAWRALVARLRDGQKSEPALPEALAPILRDYQAEGARWLLRNASWAEGACLADEMGLGKTVQTLAALATRASLGPALVVCPTSLSDNWRQECLRFTPSLQPVIYRGSDRATLLGSIGPGTLLIASYDIVARDREALSAVALSTLVLDEAQAIKNPQAQRTQAIRALQSSMRIALTGTPIENRLSELYSLFSILTPGLLGSWESFRKRFVLPIERHGDRDKLLRLREILRPFLLRRTKAQVARELPPRTEVVRPVDLSEAERALYEAERRYTLEKLKEQRAASKKKDAPDVRFALLAALTRLRRLVCHPSLVFEESTAPSSKLDELVSLIDDLRADGHRALVFSQFTSLLAIVRKRFSARGIRYLYLDGSTPASERAALVDEWQSGDAHVFLISLKAGGTGLNLTAADYVVHLDPWWNPAVEDQASDRAHRIGQDKPVTVVRLVAQGTIEERVLALHEDKRKLASGILEGAETNATLDTDELLALLDE